MPQSLVQILVHLVFSTKNREAVLTDDTRDELHAYTGSQAEHHRTLSFQDEYRRLLRQYGVPFDERYVWD